MSEPRVQFIFCDDHRPEINGKHSLMGVLRGYVSLPARLPFMPRFAAVIEATLPHRLAGAPLCACLKLDGAPLLELKAPFTPAPAHPAATEAGVPDLDFLTFPLELLGHPFPHGGRLQATFTIGDYSFESEPLTILRPDAAQAGAVPADQARP